MSLGTDASAQGPAQGDEDTELELRGGGGGGSGQIPHRREQAMGRCSRRHAGSVWRTRQLG